MSDSDSSSSSSDSDSEVEIEQLQAIDVIYCGVCGAPPEYCDFVGKKKACAAWLADWVAENGVTGLEGLSLDDLEADSKGGADDEGGKDKPKPAKSGKGNNKKKKGTAKEITIQRQQRQKRKFITVVGGLEHFDIPHKECSKLFANKFACGASVTTTASKEKQIDIQGDFVYEVEELLLSKYKALTKKNIRVLEEKRKGKKDKVQI